MNSNISTARETARAYQVLSKNYNSYDFWQTDRKNISTLIHAMLDVTNILQLAKSSLKYDEKFSFPVPLYLQSRSSYL